MYIYIYVYIYIYIYIFENVFMYIHISFAHCCSVCILVFSHEFISMCHFLYFYLQTGLMCIYIYKYIYIYIYIYQGSYAPWKTLKVLEFCLPLILTWKVLEFYDRSLKNLGNQQDEPNCAIAISIDEAGLTWDKRINWAQTKHGTSNHIHVQVFCKPELAHTHGYLKDRWCSLLLLPAWQARVAIGAESIVKNIYCLFTHP